MEAREGGSRESWGLRGRVSNTREGRMSVREGVSVREGEGVRMIVFSLLLLVAGGQGRQAPCTQQQARHLQVCTGW